MGNADPHIHVEVNVLHADVALRNTLASTFGLAGDLPAEADTGCGTRVRYAMTSPRPDRVTCLACREHAARQHLHFAEQVERLGRIPGAVVSAADTARAAAQHRNLAAQFADLDRR